MTAHPIGYQIHGDDMQVVEIELDRGETVVAEAGVMNWMEDGISFETKMGDGSRPEAGLMDKLFSAAKRTISGESVFMTHFTNNAGTMRRVAFAAPYPGKIIPIDLAAFGGELLCQKDAFLCAALGTGISIAFTKRFGAGLFGGEGFILQRLQGDGLSFVHSGGTVIEKELRGETLRVDTGCLVAFSPALEYDIEMAGNLKSMFFGGEGLFLATLKGRGRLYLQTLPFSRLADRVIRASKIGMGRQKDEGSVLGAFGKMIGGK